MKRAPFLATLAASVALPAFAMGPVSGIDVTFDPEALESPAAAQFWSDLEGDLETAILERVPGEIGAIGTEISVDIIELDLSESMMNGMSPDAALSGSVVFAEIVAGDEEAFERERELSYQLRIVAGSAASEGVSDPVIYQAMVDEFAENVVSRLQ